MPSCLHHLGTGLHASIAYIEAPHARDDPNAICARNRIWFKELYPLEVFDTKNNRVPLNSPDVARPLSSAYGKKSSFLKWHNDYPMQDIIPLE